MYNILENIVNVGISRPSHVLEIPNLITNYHYGIQLGTFDTVTLTSVPGPKASNKNSTSICFFLNDQNINLSSARHRCLHSFISNMDYE